ncbi:phosphate starvation-inducible protein PhoH [Solibacillus sp. R5-41]|uniref:phosphate starvation-inducible protein PhoH n=1 Tax=Solibacillus sp. R5-41 TaxID=2048654 RepID=UPI000C129714|nr:phosphate starvation-inducible protein PhoH [Solibacillus sp. R5-41]ATP41197.1 phosphate starvation-inducible protein PhoH [Solibacillus sp. R5-41]
MTTKKEILILDPGNAFGLERRTNPFINDNMTLIDQYELVNTDLSFIQALIIPEFVDQRYLALHKELIEQFLNDQKLIVFCGHIYIDWLPGASLFIPKIINHHTDYALTIIKDQGIFAGVNPDDMTYNKGVSGFFARGYHPVPANAEVLVTLPNNEPVTYIDRNTTKGTILAHAGNDLIWYYKQNKTTDRISEQLLQWIHSEIQDLHQGSKNI